jgi:hypothetical protein
MPALHRSFNPYSSAPPPPASLPDYIISPSTIESLTNEQAGALIDSFLQSQNGKILTLHRLADHLLGRTQVVDDDDIKELEDVLEEERRREGGVVHVQPEEISGDETEYRDTEHTNQMPTIETDKKRARKEERRIKKEKKHEKRKRDEIQHNDEIDTSKESKKVKKEKKHKSKERH